MRPVLLLLVLGCSPLAALADGLTDEVEAGDLVLRTPRGFWPLELDVEGSAALAPGGADRARLLLALAERRPDAASLVVSRIDEPMPAGPDARDRVARAVVDHFQAMGLPFKLRWTTPLQRPPGAVELVGRVEIAGVERAVAVAAGPDGEGQWMVTLAAPPQRLDELLGPFEATVASLRADPLAEPAGPPDWMILAGFAGAGLAAAGLSRLVRRRR